MGALLVAWTVAGCAEKKAYSTNLRTKGIGAAFRVEAPGESKGHAYASMYAGSPRDSASPLVELEDGDHLTVTVAGTTYPMRENKDPLTGAPAYQADFPQPPPGALVEIALVRPSDISAPKSSCTLPQTFEIVSPAKGSEIVFGRDAVVVRWDNSRPGDQMVVSIDGECITVNPTLTVDDTGAVTITKDMLKLHPLCTSACKDISKSCDVLLRVGKKQSGGLDPALAQGGSIECVQGRSVMLKVKSSSAPALDGGSDASGDGG